MIAFSAEEAVRSKGRQTVLTLAADPLVASSRMALNGIGRSLCEAGLPFEAHAVLEAACTIAANFRLALEKGRPGVQRLPLIEAVGKLRGHGALDREVYRIVTKGPKLDDLWWLLDILNEPFETSEVRPPRNENEAKSVYNGLANRRFS